MKVDNFYKTPEVNAEQANPEESSTFATYGKPYSLGRVYPIQCSKLLPTESNLETGNVPESTRPGYTIRKYHFEEIVGPSVMNLQNAYN